MAGELLLGEAGDPREERGAVARVVDRAEHGRRGDGTAGLVGVQVAFDRGALTEAAARRLHHLRWASTPV